MKQLIKTVLSCKTETQYSLNNFPPHPAPKPLVTTSLLSVSVNLIILGTYMGTHPVLLFFVTGLSDVASCPVGPSSCGMGQNLLPFLWINNVLLYVRTTFIYSSLDRYLGCFHLWAIVNGGRDPDISEILISIFCIYTQKWDQWII